MEYQTQVSNIDFVLPEVWEGPGAELHLNDLTAAKTPFGQKILSGITSMILASTPVIKDVGWGWPSSLKWEFRSPVLSDAQLSVHWQSSDKREDAHNLQATVRSNGTQIASSGEIRYGSLMDSDNETQVRNDGSYTFGRTLFDADVELFSWWMSKSGLEPLDGNPGDDVPWPLFVSLAGGMFARMAVTADTPDDVVNRGMDWTFMRPLRVGESLRGYLHEGAERASRSRPGWSVWQGQCDFFAEGQVETPVAIYQATAMFYRAQAQPGPHAL